MNLEAIAAALDVEADDLVVLPAAEEEATIVAKRAPGKLGPDDTVYRISAENGVFAVSVKDLDSETSPQTGS